VVILRWHTAAATGGFDMMGMKARFGIGAVTAALAVLAVAGCSGSGSGGGGTSGAGGTSTAAGGSRPTGDAAALGLVADVMNKADAASTVKMTGTVTTSATGKMEISGEEQYSPSLELSISTQVSGQNLSEVLLGDTFYMNYAELSGALDGKQWAELDLSKLDGSLGSLSSLVQSAKSYNPVTGMEALIASGRVVKDGPATVNGQQTTRYGGTFTAAELAQLSTSSSQLTPSQESEIKQLFSSAGLVSESVDVWVGSNGLPVEEQTVAKVSGLSTTSVMYLSDWGQPVHIGAPPASEVYNMTNQLNGAVAGAGASTSATTSS
jgi:hypothetical protein